MEHNLLKIKEYAEKQYDFFAETGYEEENCITVNEELSKIKDVSIINPFLNENATQEISYLEAVELYGKEAMEDYCDRVLKQLGI